MNLHLSDLGLIQLRAPYLLYLRGLVLSRDSNGVRGHRPSSLGDLI